MNKKHFFLEKFDQQRSIFVQFHRMCGHFYSSLACENDFRIQKFKILDFFEETNHNPTQKSAILSITKMSKMTDFSILPFS